MSGPADLELHPLACADWSAAKDGPRVAYRMDGEQMPNARKFPLSH